MKTFYTTNNKETEEIGLKLAQEFKGGEVLALVGNLGAGKTTLTKGIAQGLGIKKNICSPTFVIMNQHRLKKEDIKYLYHLDAYRLKTKKDLENIAFFDIINNPENVVIIEWADRIKKYLPKKTITVRINITKSNNEGRDGSRKITVS